MDAWIETASGNLLFASSVTHILVKESTPGGTFEVVIGSPATTAAFATGLAGRPAAQAVRNSVAMAISRASTADTVQLLTYCQITGTTCTEEMAA